MELPAGLALASPAREHCLHWPLPSAAHKDHTSHQSWREPGEAPAALCQHLLALGFRKRCPLQVRAEPGAMCPLPTLELSFTITQLGPGPGCDPKEGRTIRRGLQKPWTALGRA